MNAPLNKEQIALLMSDSLTYRSPAVEGMEGAVDAAPTRGLVARMGRWMATLAAMPRRRAVLDELAMLNDRELADIGLHRAELTQVFDPSFARGRRQDVAARS